MKKFWGFFFAGVLLISTAVPAAEGTPEWLKNFSGPPAECRPWTRWWWPGGDVDEAELRREVKTLAESGFGGAEIQPFTMGLDPDADKEEMARRMSFDSAGFYQKLSAVMEEARKQGMGIDLNLGSGWPSGGAHIGPQKSLKTLLWSDQKVRGPGQKSINLKGPRKTVFYRIADIGEMVLNTPVARWHGDKAKIEAVIAARIIVKEHQWKLIGPYTTYSLDPESLTVLTGRVDEDGRLEWKVPDGRWLVITAWSAPDGEFPTLAAQDPPGYVVDHFDRETAMHHLDHLLGKRTGLEEYYGRPMRAFFNDSFEFKTERHYAPDFFAEFEKRRGYDLQPLLPAALVQGGDNFFLEVLGAERSGKYELSETDPRVRYDYSLTVSDLFMESYLDVTRQWGQAHGIKSRAQCYGMDIDLIRAAGRVHIPETEQLYAGGSEMFLKIASSGAHLYGKDLVTAESMVWSNRDYLTIPLKIKTAADKLFTSGVNSIIYHGFSYKKDSDYGETGWYPWSSPYVTGGYFSSNISEANPFWKYMEKINLYVTRCQHLLRQGKPAFDLAVYYPWLGLPSSFSEAEGHEEFLFNGRLPGFDPERSEEGIEDLLAALAGKGYEHDPRVKWLKEVWPLLSALEDSGFSWEWVNDHSLEAAQADEGMIEIRGNSYKALVLAHSPWMQPAAAKNLASLAEDGAAFVIAGDPPARQPGYGNHRQGDAAVTAAMKKVISSQRTLMLEDQTPRAGNLAEIHVLPGLDFMDSLNPVRHIRRILKDGAQIIFLRNPTDRGIEFDFKVQGTPAPSVWLDPWNGKTRSATAWDGGKFTGRMEPYGSIFLYMGKGARVPEMEEISFNAAESLSPDWTLRVEGDDVAGGVYESEPSEFTDWREIKELRYCGSPATYTARFHLDKEENRVILRLGWIHGAAEVRANGEHTGTLLVPPWEVDLSGFTVPGENTIEIIYTPHLRNRLVGRARGLGSDYKHMKGRPLAPAGITGKPEIALLSASSGRD